MESFEKEINELKRSDLLNNDQNGEIKSSKRQIFSTSSTQTLNRSSEKKKYILKA